MHKTIFSDRKFPLTVGRLRQKGEITKAAAVINQKFRFNPRIYLEEEQVLIHQLRLQPDNLRLLLRHAKNCFIRGVNRTAEALLRRTLQLHENNPIVLSNLGYFLLHTGKEVEAEEVLQRAVQTDPRCGLAWCNLAELELRRTQRTQRAGNDRYRDSIEDASRRRTRAEEYFRTALRANSW